MLQYMVGCPQDEDTVAGGATSWNPAAVAVGALRPLHVILLLQAREWAAAALVLGCLCITTPQQLELCWQ